MLATSRTGERSRRWVHERIWGSRDRANAQASLRRELSSLRTLVNTSEAAPLIVRSDAVALDLANIVIDVRDPRKIAASREEFLEGIDIAWEEGFEEWLREERQAIQSLREEAGESSRSPEDGRSRRSTVNNGCPRLGIVVARGKQSQVQAAWCNHIAHDLAERCVALRWLHVVETPLDQDKGDTAATVRIGRLLNLDYVVTCALRPGNIDIGLLDALTGRAVWTSHTGIADFEDVDELARVLERVVAQISFHVEIDQSNRTFGDIADEELDFGGLLWRARWHKARLSRHDLAVATALLRQAERLNPNANELLIEQVECELVRIWAMRDFPKTFDKLHDRLALARDKDPSDARAWLLLGVIDMWRGRSSAALALFERAAVLNPSLPQLYGQLGVWNILFGSPHKAIALVNKAVSLAPADKKVFYRFAQLSLAHLMEGEYAKAVERADSCIAIRPGYLQGYIYGIVAHWLNGSADEACRIGRELLSLDSDYDPGHLLQLPFKDPKWPKTLHETYRAVIQRIEKDRHFALLRPEG